MIELSRYEDAGQFLADAGEWLYQSETEHTLILGIAQRLVEFPDFYEPPIYFAVLRDQSGIVGCAYRTPPHKLVMTRLPEDGVPLLVEDVATVYDSIPATMGPESLALTFSEQWSTRRGLSFKLAGRERIHELSTVISPRRMPSGFMRTASDEDHDLALNWFEEFTIEATSGTSDQSRIVGQKIRDRSVWLWDDGRPVSMAALASRTRNVARIGYVYTPPDLRCRGYATACVARASQLLLDSGLTACCLYTDLANPVSNSIYRQIGYRPIMDVADTAFVGTGTT